MHSTTSFATLAATPLLTEFTDHVSQTRTPAAVLDVLHACASRLIPLSVMGAARIPLRTSDWRSTRLGTDVFLHSSVPEGWWEEYIAIAAREYDPGLMMARGSLMACTWTETMQMLEPIGIDRWPYELALKYGMRDALTCSVGRRWMVGYWSRQTLSGKVLTQPHRIILFAAASFAALRLEQLIDHDPRWMGKRARVTPRELAVLRLVSMGRQTEEIARVLGLGDETVRSHLKKVQSKLGVRNRAHAVAEAIRQHLIP
jgi:LuxR family quorum sensing-dependent transcriptional regulator